MKTVFIVPGSKCTGFSNRISFQHKRLAESNTDCTIAFFETILARGFHASPN